MICKQCQALLLDYLEGTIAPSNRAQAEQHLENCSTCQCFLDQLTLLKDRLCQRPLSQASRPPLWHRVLNQPLLKLALTAIAIYFGVMAFIVWDGQRQSIMLETLTRVSRIEAHLQDIDSRVTHSTP